MPGNIEQQNSPDDFPTPQDAARLLIDKAHRGVLLNGYSWAQFEGIAPGATQAGRFVEVVKKAKQLKVRSSESFTLAKMIWYEVNGLLPSTLHQEMSGEARAILVALVGGQLYTSAIKQGVPESIGDFYNDPRPTPTPHSLTELFAIPLGSSMQLYGGGPQTYRSFKSRVRANPLFSEEELLQTIDVVNREAKDKVDQYRVASRVLLEVFIGKLQRSRQQEIEQAPPSLLTTSRRIVSDA